jgi:uncharacterized protein YoxC
MNNSKGFLVIALIVVGVGVIALVGIKFNKFTDSTPPAVQETNTTINTLLTDMNQIETEIVTVKERQKQDSETLARLKTERKDIAGQINDWMDQIKTKIDVQAEESD